MESLSFLFLDDFEGNANFSVAIEFCSRVTKMSLNLRFNLRVDTAHESRGKAWRTAAGCHFQRKRITGDINL